MLKIEKFSGTVGRRIAVYLIWYIVESALYLDKNSVVVCY